MIPHRKSKNTYDVNWMQEGMNARLREMLKPRNDCAYWTGNRERMHTRTKCRGKYNQKNSSN